MTISPGSDLNSEVVKVEVSRPKLHYCQSHKFVDYEITIETTNKAFSRKYSTVRRRYSEFCWLRAKLSSTEINGFNRWEIPSLPPKNYFGRFDKALICSRQQGLQDFVEKIVRVNAFLSFAGLHLFLQTQLSYKEIEGFLEGAFGEYASVEEVICSQEHACDSEKQRQLCTSKDCKAIIFSDVSMEENPITTDTSRVETQDSDFSASSNSSEGFPSSRTEPISFLYTMYK